mmetsp:Transcript_31714/g.53287  ORF Transcript_31714/g.53287 Transcript_31714/m.53287 type:complete len:89 (-) Transcript_31714:1160-1426(-)
MTREVSVAARPEVGSSRKSRVGSAASSMPMFTRFFCPPEMPRFSTVPTRLVASSVNCSDSITCVISLSLLSVLIAEGRRRRPLYWIFS